MIKVVWDDSLPPTPPEKTEEERAIQAFDEWFTLVGLSKEWAVVR